MDFDAFDALTFDCYGTLIDWERGILSALDELLGVEARSTRSADEFLEIFARLEGEAESGAHRPYRAVLTDVARGFGRALGRSVADRAASDFAESVRRWPPYPDSARALRALGTRYRLAVVSNVDDDLFAGSAAQLGIDFDEVVTAQQVRSYKPAHGHFREVARRLGLGPGRILHVAQSLYHDIAPAKELGWTCVWVDRRGGKEGSGATPRSSVSPDLRVPDLASLAAVAGVP